MSIDHHIRELVASGYRPRRISAAEGSTVVAFPENPPSSVEDRTAAALELVSEAAAAMKGSEEHAAEMVARAEALANQAFERLQAAEARIQRAEAGKRNAELEAADTAEALARVRHELEQAEARLSECLTQLAAAEDRANLFEQRANDAEAAFERIVEAVRTQLAVARNDAEKEASNVA